MNKNQLSAFLQKGNRTTWCVFFLFAFSIFLKCMWFHWLCYQTLPVSAIFHHPHRLLVYLSKAAMAVFVASFVFLSKRKHWTVVVSILLDIWIIANFIYFRANNLFITLDAIMMANNMNGFWSSVILYMNWKALLFPLITIVYALLIYLAPLNIHRHFTSFLITTLLTLVLWIGSGICWCIADKEKDKPTYQHFVPFWAFTDPWAGTAGNHTYHQGHSIASYFVTCILEGINLQYYRATHNEIEFTEEELDFLNLPHNDLNLFTPDGNMIVILVESLESWTLEYPQATPSLNSIIANPHTLYADKITSQVRHGVSGDGQMIINTGLLPISSGAACMIYGNNTYPNFAHFYQRSCIYNPSIGVWNQQAVTKAYEYKDLVEPQSIKIGEWFDAEIFQIFSDSLSHRHINQNPFISLVITISTHTPFLNITQDYQELNLTENTPETLKHYFTCLHYTDSCIGAFMDEFMQSELASNTTVVITGDHTIFKDAMLREFIPFAKEHNLSIQNGKNYCPLIIYSPSITEPIRIEDVCYQMDIYPTILSLIGAEGYYWQGFGVNLMDSTARHNRSITEEDAYILSDKLIRSNWFATQP